MSRCNIDNASTKILTTYVLRKNSVEFCVAQYCTIHALEHQFDKKLKQKPCSCIYVLSYCEDILVCDIILRKFLARILRTSQASLFISFKHSVLHPCWSIIFLSYYWLCAKKTRVGFFSFLKKLIFKILTKIGLIADHFVDCRYQNMEEIIIDSERKE